MRWLVAISFLFSSLARPQIYSRADQLLWHTESRVALRKFVLEYNAGAKEFSALGPWAFAAKLSDFDSDERKWILKKVNRIDQLPELKVTENTLQVFEESKLVAELSIEEMSRGIFRFPDQVFRYDFRRSMMDNHKAWLLDNEQSNRFFHGLFLPMADAKKKKGTRGKFALIGGLLGALIGAMFFKKSSKTMGSVAESGGALTAGETHSGVGGGAGGGTTGGTSTGGGATTGGLPPDANPEAQESPAGSNSDAGHAKIGVTDFPAEGEDLLAGCPEFVDPNTDQSANFKVVGEQKIIFEMMKNVSNGGTYNAKVSSDTISTTTVDAIANATSPVSIGENMCSQTTQILYLAYLRKKHGATADLSRLFPKQEHTDGIGPWGFWNANGPGTASYFHQGGAGTNTAKTANAKPGDFLKIFWKHSDGPGLGNISSDQGGEGHSVVFLGCKEGKLCTWGSHTSDPNGIGVKCYPKDKLGLLIYSSPNGSLPAPGSLEQDPFLVHLHKNTIRGRANVIQALQPKQ